MKKIYSFTIQNNRLNYRDGIEINENDERYIPHGWGNGYVAIPRTHPLFGVGYSNYNLDFIEIHGGLTFSRGAEELKNSDWEPHLSAEVKNNLKDYWVVGFDTCHCDDTQYNWPKELVEAETESLKQQIINYDLF